MIPTIASLPPFSLASTGNGDVVPLAQRLASAQPLPATSNQPGQDFDSDPLARAFLDALRTLPPTDDLRAYANAVSQLMREFVNPETDEPAFITLEQQSDILQRAMAQLETDDPLSKPLQATLIGTSNLQTEMTKWMQNICMSDGNLEEFEEW
ncbi:hypothetical protein [Chromobacterium sp. ASV23]|uniref:hypothetical protein n=1 Tax=Chromobacterium sp. ASV23 TaxID=2795110 RepID=UPI0018ECCCF6|nr:hypothetical protein [Chromobacterium sp. ASV23]